MAIKIFHISDIHIGMKFQRYPDILRANLIESRFGALRNAVTEADRLKCDVLAITGDIFETIKVAKRDVVRVTEILGAFSGDYIWILPGNHDYYDQQLQLWQTFSDSMPDNCVLMNESKVYSFEVQDIEVDVYASPCDSKHSEVNNIGWVKTISPDKNRMNILLAHGSIKEISPDLHNEYFPMTLQELGSLDVDLSLIGHTHVPYPLSQETTTDRVYNAGTPEPDGLNYRFDGSGWYIELDRSKNIYAKKVRLGNYKFYDIVLKVNDQLNETELLKPFANENLEKLIVRIHLDGYLDQDHYENRYEVMSAMEEKFAYVEINEMALKPKFTQETIDKSFTKDSVPYALLMKLIDESDGETAHLAYELMMEVMDND
ncbi:MAG: metallophosphoesterase [Clostridia bacterium]|nr:metallophosphoesterase [Clostridia bacterium]